MATHGQVSDYVLRWEVLRSEGQHVSAEELCRDAPELVGAVQEALEALLRLAPVLTDSVGAIANGRTGGHLLPEIPGYEILELLGQGGMGVVYRARELTLGREVALKMLRDGAAAGPRLRERFRNEARAMARLDHPHIVPIFEPGEHGGQPYFTMKFVGGGTLADHQGRLHADLRAAATTLAKVARAVDYLHHKLWHRDLKPSNILLDEAGEPYVSDFGLARLLDTDLELTRTGQAPGTRPYMAPEQIAGWLHRISRATDIWALGVILFEVLTGRRPFEGPAPDELAHRICHEAPPPPRSLRPDLPADLIRICLRCLEKDPHQRYASAGDLAADLESWLREDGVAPRGLAGRLARAARKVHRHPVFIAVPVLFALTAALALSPALPSPPDRPLPPEGDAVQILAKEKVVTLIPAVGRPASGYKSWVTEARPLPSPDKVFTLSTAGLSLAELLPRVPGPAFRFSAEVWHRSQRDRSSLVGLYFGHGARDTPHGREHSYYHLAFNDIDSMAERIPELSRLGNYLSLIISLCYEKPLPSCSDRETNSHIYFQPAGAQGATTWRKLVVEVRPSAVQARWEDRERLLPRLALKQQVNFLFENHHLFKRGRPDFGRPPFDPSRALGVYLRDGTAGFRNVKVELLDNSR